MFLDFFQGKFEKKHNRRLWKIFKLMSEFIETRSPNQCRSHHQKMERNHKSVSQIITVYKSDYSKYDERYSKIKCLLAELNTENSILLEREDQDQAVPNQNLDLVRKFKLTEIFGLDSQNSMSSKMNGKLFKK